MMRSGGSRLRDASMIAMITCAASQPLVTSAAGQFRFFAAPGTWTLRALSREGNGNTTVAANRGINEVAVSSGSACTSASLEPSYVLKALGAGDDLAHSSIRFGLGRWTTEEEVDYVADKLAHVVTRLREMSPLYELAKEGVDLSTMQWQTEGH